MKRKASTARQQRGFTLVEMSVTLVIAGLLFAAVATSKELIAQAKSAKMLNEIKTFEGQLQQYAQFKGRLPGDCNADGIIDYAADATPRNDTGNTLRAQQYSYSLLLPTIPLIAPLTATEETDGCALIGTGDIATVAVSTTNANVWLNDLKLAGLVSDSAPNRDLAKTVNEDFLFVGKVTDNGGVSADAADYNAIVIHNVPQWMARRLAVAINGQDARADRSRVRLLSRGSSDGTYSATWQTNQVAGSLSGSATQDAMVTVVYFFDRVPESQGGEPV